MKARIHRSRPAQAAKRETRNEKRTVPPRPWGYDWGYLILCRYWTCCIFRHLRGDFDSDLGHHQLFKYCRALELGVPRSVVERPASTQGAVQPEPVGRDRRDGAHANPTSNASRSDPNVFFPAVRATALGEVSP